MKTGETGEESHQQNPCLKNKKNSLRPKIEMAEGRNKQKSLVQFLSAPGDEEIKKLFKSDEIANPHGKKKPPQMREDSRREGCGYASPNDLASLGYTNAPQP